MKEALISGNWEKTILLGSTKEKIIMFFVQDLTLRDASCAGSSGRTALGKVAKVELYETYLQFRDQP